MFKFLPPRTVGDCVQASGSCLRQSARRRVDSPHAQGRGSDSHRVQENELEIATRNDIEVR